MKYYVLFFFVLFLCACTGDENSSSCSVSVQLLSPTDEVTLPFEEMEVVLTNVIIYNPNLMQYLNL